MLIQCDLDKVGSGVVNKCGTLIIVGELKELLAQVVSKWIWKTLADDPRNLY